MGDDLAAYLADSEQVNCALALGVSINRGCSVRAAGGYLIQARALALLTSDLQWRAVS